MPRRSYTLTHCGDTMVEVLLAMAIVTSVLGGAYVSANRSFSATQASKDRDTALRIAETQLERIRGYREANPSATINNSTCITSTLTVVSNGGPPPSLSLDVLDGNPVAYNAQCIVDPSSATYAGNSIPFHVFIEVSGNDYAVHVRWARSGGGENQETTVKYRIY